MNKRLHLHAINEYKKHLPYVKNSTGGRIILNPKKGEVIYGTKTK